MVVKIKVYEFEDVKELKEYEQQKETVNKSFDVKPIETEKPVEIIEQIEIEKPSEIIEQIEIEKVVEPEEQKVSKPYVKYSAKKNMQRWTAKETKKFANQIIKYRDEGIKLSKAMKLCAEQFDRSVSTLYWKKSELGIMYVGVDKKSKSKEYFIPSGMNTPYTKMDDDLLINYALNKSGKGGRISSKDYKILGRRLKRSKIALKGRVSHLRRTGVIKTAGEIKLEKIKLRKKPKKEKSNSGYMITNKANLPLKNNLFSNLKSKFTGTKIREYIFSDVLSKESEILLKALINNDIKQRGICKLSMEKMNLIMNIKKDSFEKFSMDVLRYSSTIKKTLKISIIDFRKELGGDYLVFS